MERTWKPTAAGILCITLGVVCAPFSLLINMIITVVSGEPGGTELPIATIAGCWIIGGIAVITPIIGGIYALRRRMWGLALAGSICALILAIIVGFYFVGVLLYPMLSGWTLWVLSSVVCGIPGILAVIFVVRGKREFK